jgi:hypothetical protein
MRRTATLWRIVAAMSLAISVCYAVNCSDSPSTDNTCQHGCDLSQTLRIEVQGAQTAASVVVDGPCATTASCGGDSGCRTIDVTLKDTGVPAGDAGTALVCHITVTSTSGLVEQRDALAHYSDDSCCPGYSFDARVIDLGFATPD